MQRRGLFPQWSLVPSLLIKALMLPQFTYFFHKRSRPWISVFLTAMLAIGTLSFFFEVYSSKESVRQYLFIWEDDIARAKVFSGDPSLQDKIIKQLNEVDRAVARAEVQNPQDLQCLFFTDIPITLNSLPVGDVRVCFSEARLAVQAATSPVFLIGLFLGLIFIFFGTQRDLLNQLKEHDLQAKLKLSQEISTMARQVAHDIRGPLTALTTLSRLSHEMSAEKQDLLSLSVKRIQGIADDLLDKGRQGSPSFESSSDKILPEALSSMSEMLQNLLKEYRFSYPKIVFEWHDHTERNKVQVRLEDIKIQRIVSNLLNNAIEAAPEADAVIHLTFMERGDQYLLQVMDNGCGISEEVLPRLTEEGFSHGKVNGHGLGLYDAKKTLQATGGDIQIRSRQGMGTQVVLILPKANSETTLKVQYPKHSQ